MEAVEEAHKILDSMLGHLGFTASIEIQEEEDGPCLQILSGDSKHLIGREGERLDDIQYLVNRILRRTHLKAPKIKVDCEHYRTMREEKMADEVLEIAARVKQSGEPYKMRPLNAYYRRLVHNILINDPDVMSISPEGDDRLKRISIVLKSSQPSGS
jgi:spoIIIJ-associated protein